VAPAGYSRPNLAIATTGYCRTERGEGHYPSTGVLGDLPTTTGQPVLVESGLLEFQQNLPRFEVQRAVAEHVLAALIEHVKRYQGRRARRDFAGGRGLAAPARLPLSVPRLSTPGERGELRHATTAGRAVDVNRS